MKLILIDDEAYIIDMLKSLIEWKQLGLELCGTATDGLSALEYIKQKKPDIVVTDIRIPHFDGLELIRKCREAGLNAQFIIISGFKQFEYAQNAIRYDVKEYLLKPIKKRDINLSLARVTRIIEEETRREWQSKEKDVMLNQGKKSLNQTFLNQLISERFTEEGGTDTFNKKYMLELREGLFQVLIYKIDFSNNKDLDASFISTITDRILSEFHEVAESCYVSLDMEKDTRVFFFINYDKQLYDAVQTKIKAAFDGVYKFVIKFRDLSLTLGKGISVDSLHSVYDSYKNAESALRQRILSGVNRILEISEQDEAESDLNDQILSGDWQKSLRRCIDSFDIKCLTDMVYDVIATLEKSEIVHERIYWEVCKSIVEIFWTSMLNLHLVEKIDWGQIDEEFNKLLDGCATVRVLKFQLAEYLRSQFKLVYDSEKPPENVGVLIARRYITNHYSEKILLKDIAEQAYLNPVYLSICFKKETGVNIVEYINEYRIERAKEFLMQVDLSIAEISEKVGFKTPRYFTSIFKRYMEMTPAEYRKKIAGRV